MPKKSTYLCWSFDPTNDTLDVWDSKDGSISHFDRHGEQGLLTCAQGRIYENSSTVYGNRPYAPEAPTSDAIRSAAMRAVNDYLIRKGGRTKTWRVVF